MRLVYFAQTIKVGNSIYVKIPKNVRKVCEIDKNDYVRIEIQKIGYTEIVLGPEDRDE